MTDGQEYNVNLFLLCIGSVACTNSETIMAACIFRKMQVVYT